MSDDTVLETAIHEPAMTAGEAEMLLFALERSRAQLAWKCGGLDAAGLGRRHPPSTMTLGGLVKHLALVEDWTAASKLKGQSPGAPWDAVDFESDPDWEWRTGAEDDPQELRATYDDCVRRADDAIDEALARGGLDAESVGKDSSGDPFRLRWIMLHMIEEYARHNGHADLLREAVDGETGE